MSDAAAYVLAYALLRTADAVLADGGGMPCGEAAVSFCGHRKARYDTPRVSNCPKDVLNR